ncbi:SRPBCC domain-containing protein [Phycicoccus sp. Soil802]|uniref:SRPBCC domain-containing protein n=1 Tax=Phycicoccus sp. Soil802 TaxID=1736414 RepID=UPI000B1CAEC4|nr:SRPBCC domain-containing protein [Phycicoccus sp. Soil802]
MTAETVPSTSHPIAPVRREVRVRCDADTAFELFTAHLGAWWPLGTHSVFGAEGSVAFEDGTVVERRGADTAVWGTVLRWERPVGFAMTWHPGQGPERATEVAVEFTADGDGTLVTLTHTGWERLAEPEAARADYDRGWPLVLGGLEQWVERAGAGAGAGTEPTGEWFALHHRPGPGLADGGSVFAHPLFREHVAFLHRLRERGWLVAAGPVDAANGAGMAVVHIPVGAGPELDELARTDDGSVTGGVLSVTVQPWDVRFTAAD